MKISTLKAYVLFFSHGLSGGPYDFPSRSVVSGWRAVTYHLGKEPLKLWIPPLPSLQYSILVETVITSSVNPLLQNHCSEQGIWSSRLGWQTRSHARDKLLYMNVSHRCIKAGPHSRIPLSGPLLLPKLPCSYADALGGMLQLEPGMRGGWFIRPGNILYYSCLYTF